MEMLVTKILKDLKGRIHQNNNEIIINSKRKRKDTFLKSSILEVFPLEELLTPDTYQEIESLNRKDYKALPQLLLESTPSNDDRRRDHAEDSMTDQQRDMMDRFILCRESLTNELILFDKEDRQLCDFLSADAFLETIPGALVKAIVRGAPLSRLAFDAYDIKPYQKKNYGGITIIHLNAYTPPMWQKKYPEAKEEWTKRPPDLFDKFLKKLVPYKNERIIVIDWLANALTLRNQSFLSLRGARGNGKTLFMKMMMAVVGHHYFAKDGINKDGFNADMRHKRIIGIDDDTFIGSYSGYRLRKQLTNTSVTYNAKFQQTTKSEKQFASYIIASNDEDAFYVTHEERKIVSVTLSESNAADYLTVKERDWIDILPKEATGDFKEKDLLFLAHLGHWLLAYAKRNAATMHSPNAQYGGGCFWEDVVKSLSLMARLAVEKALSREYDEVSYDELLMEFDEYKSAGGREVRKRFPQLSRELLRFRYGEGNERLFESVNDKMFTLKVAADYRPKPDEEEIDV